MHHKSVGLLIVRASRALHASPPLTTSASLRRLRRGPRALPAGGSELMLAAYLIFTNKENAEF